MTDTDSVELARSAVRAAKNKCVKEMRDGDPGDITPYIFFERAGQLVAACKAPVISRDVGIDIARIGICGFAADAVIWTADAHFTHSPINPATGEKWAEGEMQKACDEEGACAVGLLQDAIMLIRQERIGGVTHYQQYPYDVDKTSRQVEWLEEARSGKGTDEALATEGREEEDKPSHSVAGGLIVKELSAAFAAPSLRVKLIAEGTLPIGLPEWQQLDIDVKTALLLKMAGAQVMLIDGARFSVPGPVAEPSPDDETNEVLLRT